MAQELTDRLRRLDPSDPVKYDFALCHKRMSGDCPGRRDWAACLGCGLRSVCRHWRGVERRKKVRGACADQRMGEIGGGAGRLAPP